MKILSLKSPPRIAWGLKKMVVVAGRWITFWMMPFMVFLTWLVTRNSMLVNNPQALVGEGDTWLYMLQSMLAFFTVVPLCWWFLQRFWKELGLMPLTGLIIHFNDMELWQKLGFYFASFAVLLLSAVGCLIAIC
ncbi:hypothetical protein LPB86_15800 [Pedobacter sp. MC2016-14]|uniref:hypothetical protein n=1 Tax=Pedobacter sp. MC2016-14 TaxID=2897327 RepID=UPI001E487BBC|nr:hypothetical protein [Pedobacter sp. MC2016-14]MCD0489706.1 hypothetical protein [Pedobacter sp. MC2016-14]